MIGFIITIYIIIMYSRDWSVLRLFSNVIEKRFFNMQEKIAYAKQATTECT